MANNLHHIYPPVGFHFKVNFDGLGDTDSYFREVTGISAEFDTETHKEGGENRFLYTFPIRAKYSNITCKRGFIVGSELLNWCKDAIENLNIVPKTVNIWLLNEKHEVLQSFSLINAWPQKWTLSDLNAMESSVVLESLDLAFQNFRIM